MCHKGHGKSTVAGQANGDLVYHQKGGWICHRPLRARSPGARASLGGEVPLSC